MKSKHQALIGNEYTELFINYMQEYDNYLRLRGAHSINLVEAEEATIKTIFSESPHLYGGSDRNARTDQQWQERINYLRAKKVNLDKNIYAISQSKDFENDRSEQDDISEHKDIHKTELSFSGLAKLHSDLTQLNVNMGKSREEAQKLADLTIAQHASLSADFSAIRKVSDDVRTIQAEMHECAQIYRELYNFDEVRAFSQMQKEFMQTPPGDVSELHNQLKWFSEHKEMLIKEKEFKDKINIISKSYVQEYARNAMRKMNNPNEQLINKVHFHANQIAKARTAVDVLIKEIQDEDGYLHNVATRTEIFSSYYERAKTLHENTSRNKETPNLEGLSPFQHSKEKLGGKQPGTSDSIYRTPQIIWMDEEEHKIQNFRKTHFDEQILEAQKEALDAVKLSGSKRTNNTSQQNLQYSNKRTKTINAQRNPR